MKSVLLIVNSIENLRVHRAQLIQALIADGLDVHVAVPLDGDSIQLEGFTLHDYPLSRGSLNPFREVRSIYRLCAIIRSLRPDVVHGFTIKLVLYGSIAANAVGTRRFVGSITGMGHLFIDGGLPTKLVRWGVVMALRVALSTKRTTVIVQNEDDRLIVDRLRIIQANQLKVIKGSGVDTHRFSPLPEPEGPVTVVLAGRLLKSKGVPEFLGAAERLAKRGVAVRMVLVGDVDPANPSSLSPADIRSAVDSGVVEWWGWQPDMGVVLALTHIACLPSHREGLPRYLLEAAAVGRAVVATDVPGCREVVTDGETGLLVPLQDASALADAIERLVVDAGLRLKLGQNARVRAVKEFSTEVFAAQMLAIYGDEHVS